MVDILIEILLTKIEGKHSQSEIKANQNEENYEHPCWAWFKRKKEQKSSAVLVKKGGGKVRISPEISKNCVA